MSDRTLSVVDLAKCFGEVPVFADVSFTVGTGEAFAVVGRNGSGKSTLLKCVVGAEPFDGGSAWLHGLPLDESRATVRYAMASLLDDVDYFPDISVVEHLRLLAWLYGTSDPEKRVTDVIAELGLEQVVHQLPPTLSSGQRHRLGLAACFVRPRELLVLDEPEQRLDTQGRLWLRRRLCAEKDAEVAILFASHDTELVDSVADHRLHLGS
ncbi:ABC transporter ATP-binding protein [Haloechinothrix sp. LS1_15]|uniref:ABC transporter ATP-binding protein n=1 Tax=Haloechinothrix sp. LS1_15 TaxID=2652248 RepID=UPI002945BAA3|nr:ABC transporter ATP-binding protein [Haloechinothrix sp. LS1_15]MDV6014760.1 ABC transporter ATP-binding protein [Haloechinothrix sp. LS1_15]